MNIMTTQEAKNKLAARAQFVAEYCEARGWDPKNLSISKVLEIRQQKGWQDAVR